LRRTCSYMKTQRGITGLRIALLFLAFFLCIAFGDRRAFGSEKSPSNLILLIVDGCGTEQYTLARWMKGAPLSFEHLLVGAVRTFNAESVVTDSAPAASAYATGVRTSDKFISIGPKASDIPGLPPSPPELRLRPLATILEGARLKGMATGIVCTSRVTHATPAAFMSHSTKRDEEDRIMEQAVHQGLDIVLGGGMRHLVPKEKGGSRTDGEDLTRTLAGRGYRIIRNKEELSSLKSGRAFGLFAESHMEAELDRPVFGPDQPSLAEMTQKAVEVLSASKKGFFLMVEASQVDWACHANDPAHLVGDLLMFDRAAESALRFAQAQGNTLLIVVSDHNTGGMSIGNRATGATYSRMTPAELVEPIKRMRLTALGLWRKAGGSEARLKDAIKDYWDITPTGDEMKRIVGLSSQYGSYPATAIGEVLSATRTAVGWSTHGHTGGDVPLFAYGPGAPRGVMDAQDLGRLMASVLGLELRELTERLFADVPDSLKDYEARIERGNKGRQILRITGKRREAHLPINRNILQLAEREIPLEGVTVHVEETGKTYIPRQAVDEIKRYLAKEGND
jgi:alkaline phosphatase